MSEVEPVGKHGEVVTDRHGKADLNRDGEQGQDQAPFRFMIRPLVTRGVELGTLADWLERQAFQLVRRESFTSPAKNIMIFPKILDPSVAVISDHLTYKRKECTVYVGVNIDYRVWLNSAPKVGWTFLQKTSSCHLQR